MISQEEILSFIFSSINKIQMSKETRESFAKDATRAPIIEHRERLIEVLDGLQSLYTLRERNIKDGFVPLADDGKDHALIHEAKMIFKCMCNLSCDIVKVHKGVV
jgi:hypothetical protein